MRTFVVVAVFGAAVAAASGASARTLTATFKTPGGTVGCTYASSGAKASLRCSVLGGLKPRPTKPKSCNLDYGNGLEMNRTGRPLIPCAGDSALDPKAPVLDYGKTSKRGGFTCISYRNGLTCANARAHGWFVSRFRYQLI